MGQQTNIAWTDSTCNMWSGCTECGPGCTHCYARELSNRFPTLGKWGKGAPRQLHESAFTLATRLNKKPWVCDCCGHSLNSNFDARCKCHCGGTLHRRRIFSLSLGDWLDPEVPIEWLARMLDTIRQCDKVTWQLVTKRPELFQERMSKALSYLIDVAKGNHFNAATGAWVSYWKCGEQVPKNIWLLTSVENQEMAEERIPNLIKIPAVVRGLSCEPLLGPIDIQAALNKMPFVIGGGVAEIHFLIVGGESGPKARPCNVQWIRSLAKQGKEAGVPVFCKQLGSFPICGTCQPDSKLSYSRIELKHPKGGDPAEWPEDLRVQEFPRQ